MEDLNLRMDPLSGTACQYIKQRFEAIGIHLEGESLVNKTMAYLKSISKQLTHGVQYFIAKEHAWEEIT